MFTVESLRLNKFKVVFIPSNDEMFARYGFRNCRDAYSSSGQTVECIDFNKSKLDQIAAGEHEVYSSFYENLSESQMPLDTDTASESEKAPQGVEEKNSAMEPSAQ